MIEFGDYYCRFYTNDAQVSKTAGDDWAVATAYVVNDIATDSSIVYRCLQAHTSATLATDITNAKWVVDTGSWAAGTAHIIGQYVYYTNGTASPAFYYCATAHTAGTFAADLAAAKWIMQSVYEIPSPYGEDDLVDIRVAQSADVLFIAHPDYAPRELVRYYDTDWAFETYDFQNGPFRLDNDDSTLTMKTSVTSGTGTLTASSAYFYPTMVGGLMKLTHYVEGQSLAQKFTKASTCGSIYCGGTWRVISHGTWTGKLLIKKQTVDSTGATSAWTVMRQFTSEDDFNVDTYGNEDMSDGALPFLITPEAQVYTSGTFSGTCNVDLTSDPYYQMGVAQITSYASTTLVNIEVQRLLASTATTSNWAEGAWSDFRGFPSTVVFAQDRLIWGGSLYDPQTMWMTQTGNYYNFMRGDPLVDSDGITINLPSQKLNAINAMVPLLQLLVFSTGGEWSIGSTANNVFSPTTMQTKLNGYTGSSGIQPCVIVNRAIYVQARGCVVRDLGYDLFTDTFTGSNLSILSNHLFTNYNILDLAYQQDPDSLVWAVRDDGKLLCMTYMREQEVLAWTWHDTYDGDDLFESVCSIPGTGYNEVWVVVNRDGQRMIERMDKRLASLDREDQFFVDSGITFDATLATITDIYTKFLCHCDGVDGSTTFTDLKSHTLTAQGDAQVTNRKKKFGNGSCACYNFEANEIDYMEYSTNALIQAAYITNAVNGATGGTITTSAGNTIHTFNTDGTFVPLINGTIQVECWGAGGGGGGTDTEDWSGGGGGGGAYSIKNITITGSTSYSVIAGTGGIVTAGSAGGDGEASSFGATLVAANGGGHGGAGGAGNAGHAGAAGTGGIGDTKYNGGAGYTGGSKTVGGGGGSSGGTISNGNSATGQTGATAVTGGGNGGNGGANHTAGSAPTTPPGGGGGGSGHSVNESTDLAGGIGSNGKVVITYVTDTQTALCAFSESTIKTQGTYSLKAVASTSALNKTLTRTISSPIDLTGVDTLYFDIQSVRTGANIKIGLHDSGGTTTELTPTINSANAWETKTWDISSVANADKNAIDQIIITIVNADSSNTFYIDNFYWNTTGEGYLTAADTTDVTTGTGNFTHELFVNFDDISGEQYFMSQYAGATACWHVYKDSAHKLGMYYIFAGTVVADYIMTNSWSPLTNVQYHLDFSRNGTTARISIDGISQTLTENVAWGTNDSGNVGSVFAVGARADGANVVKGCIDEWRVSNGICRHTTDFSPPSRAYTIYGAGSASKSISGLSHLEGRTVAILADGNVEDQQAVTGGTVTLTDSSSLVHVGLPYYADLETLNVEVPLPDGTIQGRRVNISRVVMRVLNSRGGWLGPDFVTMHEFLGDYQTSTGTSLFTDDVKITLGQGYKDGGRFCFRQIDPLPITILGVIPIFTPGGTTQLS